MTTLLSPDERGTVRDCIVTMVRTTALALRDLEAKIDAVADEMRKRLPEVEYEKQPDLVRTFARCWGEAYATEMPNMSYTTVVHGLTVAIEHLGRLDLLDEALEILRASYFETQKKMRAPRQ